MDASGFLRDFEFKKNLLVKLITYCAAVISCCLAHIFLIICCMAPKNFVAKSCIFLLDDTFTQVFLFLVFVENPNPFF